MNAIKQQVFVSVETLLCVCKIFAYYQPFERHLFDDDSDLQLVVPFVLYCFPFLFVLSDFLPFCLAHIPPSPPLLVLIPISMFKFDEIIGT